MSLFDKLPLPTPPFFKKKPSVSKELDSLIQKNTLLDPAALNTIKQKVLNEAFKLLEQATTPHTNIEEIRNKIKENNDKLEQLLNKQKTLTTPKNSRP